LPERVPALAGATVVGERAPAAWQGVLEHAIFGPVRGLAEVVLFHRPSATLVLTDLAFNLPRLDRRWDRVGWRALGVPPRFGPTRTARLTLLRDRAAAGPYLRPILRWPFARVVVAHGDPLERDVRSETARAFAPWLEER
jgi:hypothetical protein